MKLLHANGPPGVHARSWYAATCNPPARPTLEGEHTADVCIIGGGYTGLSAARELAQRGQSVILLEAHRLGWGASGRNGGQLGSGYNLGQPALAKALGRERAAGLWALAERAKQSIRALPDTHGIDIELASGIVHAVHRRRYLAELHRHGEIMAREHGYDQLHPLDAEQLREHVRSPAYHGGLLDAGAWHLHPLKLATGLATLAEAAGAQLFEHSEALTLAGDTNPVEVQTHRARVGAGQLVVACNGYHDRLEPASSAHVMPINNFMLATEPLGDRLADLLPSGSAIFDTRFVVNYFRPSRDGRLLFGGGESYGYRFPADLAARTRRAMLGVFPQLADARVDYSWGGTLAITPNRLPYVANPQPHTWVAAGYSGHGVGLAVAAGDAIGAAIAGDRGAFDLLTALPVRRFPGGDRLRSVLLNVAMRGAALADRF